ncbi:MAG: threonine/homoserine/homoserine lactone efflux protein [Candidatus Paceibacteria bacterium]|jgi:threonine/homoserine/homoserine lactone efflux protein|tara:strand:+ start:260 stop:895 length:636 start_codon:yes stop_codon:yes gene_type:complete
MLGTEDLWLFISAGIALNLVPGQDFVFVASRSASQGFGAGSVAALGIGAGTLGHIFAAAFGISALLAASENAYLLIKVLGGLYLLYMGLSMLFKRTVPANSVFVSLSTSSNKTIFYQGFLTNALNPKVALFFIAFVPQFIAADSSNVSLSFLFLGFLFSFNGLIWCLIVAWFSANISAKLKHQAHLKRWSNLLAGGLFSYFGINLLMSSNH